MSFEWSPKNNYLRILMVTAAAMLSALNINTFISAGGLYPGGITGLALLLQRLFQGKMGLSLPYSLFYLAMSAPTVYLGFRYVGKRYTSLTVLFMILISVLTDVLPVIPVTYDTFLISLFGGLISGFAAGLCLMAGACSGGLDFVAMYFIQEKGKPGWSIVFGVNVVILAVAGILFGWDKALYSIILQYVVKVVINTMHTKYQKQTLFIVTEDPINVCREISNVSQHGATILPGIGAYHGEDRPIVYSVVAKAEYHKVIAAVKKTDKKAFINAVQTDDLEGRFLIEKEK